jgi:hypothetical protein
MIPQQGPLHITWEGRHLTVACKGSVRQNILTINGTIRITGGGIQHFSALDRLVVHLYYAKASGRVLDRRNLYAVSNASIENGLPFAFTRRFELPKGTTHIAFGYDGKAREGAARVFRKKGDTIEHPFQHSPFR